MPSSCPCRAARSISPAARWPCSARAMRRGERARSSSSSPRTPIPARASATCAPSASACRIRPSSSSPSAAAGGTTAIRRRVLARDAEVLDEALEDELHEERALEVVARFRVLEDEVREALYRFERLQVLGERRVVGEDDL